MAYARNLRAGPRRCAAMFSQVLIAALLGCSAATPARESGPRPPRDRVQAAILNEEGLDLIAKARLPEAEQRFKAALEADPFCGSAHSNLGVLLLQRGAVYEAAQELQTACRLMPRASQPRANLGALFEQAGRYGDAEEQLRAALALSPDDIEVIGHLARIQVRQGKRTPETRAWLQRVAVEADDAAWRSWASQNSIQPDRMVLPLHEDRQ